MVLFTMGYQGINIQHFLSKLKRQGIEVLLDIRENPVSRKVGFSKNQLQEELDEAGIRYEHLPKLGTPKPLRELLRETSDYMAFFDAFDEFLSGHEQQETLMAICERLAQEKICLLCFEDHAQRPPVMR